MSFLQDLANNVDRFATKIEAPEIGISELLAGARKTTNTGRVPLTATGAIMGLGGIPAAMAYNKATAPVSSPSGTSKTTNGTGGGGNTTVDENGLVQYDPTVVAQSQLAADNTRKMQLKGEGMMTLDQLYAMYDEIVKQIQTVGADQSGRLNKDFDTKVQDQTTAMNDGMYDVDVASSANGLGDSSWRSFDRTKVRTAADANINTLNTAREGALAEVGQMVAGDTAKYKADQAGIGRTRDALNASDNLDEIQTTTNTLDATRRGVEADKAKYQTTGEFANKAASLGKYDTTVLENTLASVVANATASPAAKAGAINDLLTGAKVDDAEKERLKNKYTQSV